MTAANIVIALPLLVIVFYCIFWGQASVLMVAKRMLISPAGRTRSSFKAVRNEAKKFIAALLLTELLRSAITFLLMLLLIVPGIIYSIRTIFYDIIMIEEGKVQYGRPLLQKSKNVVTGRTWHVFLTVLGFSLCIFLPVGIVDGAIVLLLTAADERLATLAMVLTDFIDAFASMFFLICTVSLYATLKKTPLPQP